MLLTAAIWQSSSSVLPPCAKTFLPRSVFVILPLCWATARGKTSFYKCRKRVKRVTFRSSCLSALRCPLICSYVQGKFNTVELFTHHVWQQSSVFVSCCVHTCNLGAAITVRYTEECGRDPGVCVLPKETRNRPHILYMRSRRSCNMQRTCNITYITNTCSPSFTHTQRPPPCPQTHTDVRPYPVQAVGKQCSDDNYCISGVKQARRPARCRKQSFLMPSQKKKKKKRLHATPRGAGGFSLPRCKEARKTREWIKIVHLIVHRAFSLTT